MSRLAIIADGGFIRAKLCKILHEYPDANTIYQKIISVKDKNFPNDNLFRIFYYDCIPNPHDQKEYNHPIDGSKTTLFTTEQIEFHNKVFDQLKRKDYLAFRYGELSYGGWSVTNPSIFRKKNQKKETFNPEDIRININQKGTDIKMGLDIAWIAMKRIVDIICVISGDADLVPAMKFARKEGLQVCLATLGHGINKLMIEHSDILFTSK